MKVCIVGHGPSIMTYKPGDEIDGFDKVIRLKRSAHFLEYPEIFGSRTDCVCGSATIGPDLHKHWKGYSNNFWIFVDSRHEGMTDAEIDYLQESFYPDECLIDVPLCKRWREHYVGIRSDIMLHQAQERKGRLSDDKGHKHASAGTHAILYALEHLRPEVLRLYAFDNIATGSFTWSLTRGPEWTQYPDHNWETEQRMLNDIAEAYGYEIKVNPNLVIDLCNSAT